MNFEKIFKENVSYVYNHALRLTYNPTLAEDLTQETFLRAWRNIEQLQKKESLRPWLRKICINCFLMKIRKEKGNVEISYEELIQLNNIEETDMLFSSDIPSPEDEVIVDEAVKEMQDGCFLAMARKLTLNQRIVFSLCEMFGLSIYETAQILGISQSATKGLLFRGRMNIDSFFSSHCNIINVNNPCSCYRWVDFSKQRDEIKKKMMKNKKLLNQLDYTKSNYQYDEEVRRKVRYLYHNMPDKKPNKDWYDTIIQSIQEKAQ